MRKLFLLTIFALYSVLPSRATEMVVQRGHEGQITRVALSADGAFLASAAGGDLIKLWQAQRGEFIRDLPDSREELPLAWSPDGKTLLTSARNMSYAHPRPEAGVRVRSMPSGKIIYRLRGITTPLWYDGKIIRTTDGKVLRDWNIRDGKLISTRRLASGAGKAQNLIRDSSVQSESDAEFSYAFSRNGKYLVFGGVFGKNRAHVWDAGSGRLLHSIFEKNKIFGLAAVSGDGRWLVTQGEDPAWKPPTDGPMTESAFARTFQLHLWDLTKRRIVASWPGYYSLSNGVTFLQFSRDGKRVFCGGERDAQIREVPSGKLLKKFKFQTFISLADNETRLAGGYIHELKAVSLADGRMVSMSPGTMRGGNTLKWSPDGRYLAGGELHIWDTKKASLLKSSSPDNRYLLNMHWQDDTSLQTENLSSAHRWKINPETQSYTHVQEVLPNFTRRDELDVYGNEVFVSPDGKTILANSNDFDKRGTLYVWDASGKKLLNQFAVNERKNGYADNVRVRWLPDSKRFVTSTPRGIEIWNVAQGKRERLLAAPSDYPSPTEPGNPYSRIALLAISADGKYFATTNSIGKVRGVDIWDMTGVPRRLKTLPTSLRRNASFSPDGERLALGDYSDPQSGTMVTQVWKWREGIKPQYTLPGAGLAGNSSQEAPAWSPDGKRIAIAAQSAVTIYDATSGSLIAQLAIGLTDHPGQAVSEWLIWTPEGYFNAPDAGKRRVRWMENGGLVPLGTLRDKELRDKFFQPELIGKLLQGANAQRENP